MPLLKKLGSEDLNKLDKIQDTKFDENYRIQENVVLGVDYGKGSKHPIIGENPLIRSNTIIYNDVEIGDDFKTGHNVIIREKTKIGNDVLIGTNSVIEGNCTIGNNVRIQSNVYIPTNTTIEDNVFIGPCACFTNDKYPVRIDFDLKGPIIKKGASVGANSTFLSDVEIGEGAMVAAGAIVTKDVPSFFLAIGVPARIKPLPKHLKTSNKL
ncbi:MAG TPA: DapH/DapD/GlmU-related protein [Methanobacterium sp.]|nr:DapH/DapD/GlmU-related protein [Methanobacterium sp.]